MIRNILKKTLVAFVFEILQETIVIKWLFIITVLTLFLICLITGVIIGYFKFGILAVTAYCCAIIYTMNAFLNLALYYLF